MFYLVNIGLQEYLHPQECALWTLQGCMFGCMRAWVHICWVRRDAYFLLLLDPLPPPASLQVGPVSTC